MTIFALGAPSTMATQETLEIIDSTLPSHRKGRCRSIHVSPFGRIKEHYVTKLSAKRGKRIRTFGVDMGDSRNHSPLDSVEPQKWWIHDRQPSFLPMFDQTMPRDLQKNVLPLYAIFWQVQEAYEWHLSKKSVIGNVLVEANEWLHFQELGEYQ